MLAEGLRNLGFFRQFCDGSDGLVSSVSANQIGELKAMSCPCNATFYLPPALCCMFVRPRHVTSRERCL